jgi:hypothetical protein
LIKYVKSVLWRVAKRLSYIEDARCLKVNTLSPNFPGVTKTNRVSLLMTGLYKIQRKNISTPHSSFYLELV